MGAVGTQAHLIFPRRILPGISWSPPVEHEEGGKGTPEGCTCCFRELANVLEKWRRASDDQGQASGLQTREAVYLQPGSTQPTVQQDRKAGQQAPVAHLIQRFEGRSSEAELQQSAATEDEQAQGLEKPRTPPKRESPLRLLTGESSPEEEEESQAPSAKSDMSPAKQPCQSVASSDPRLVSSKLEAMSLGGETASWKDQEDDKTLGSLPAYWPAWRISLHGIPTDSDSEASSSPSSSLHSQRSSDSSAAEDMAPAFNGGARQALKPYAQLLAEETAAMQNAAGPWRPRIEKSGKLKEIQAVNGRLRHAFERMQLLRRSRREAKLAQHAERADVTVSLMADATSAAGSAEPAAIAEGQATPRPCFNGGQVIGKTPRWVLHLQQPVVTLQRVSPAGSKAQSPVSTSSADEVPDAAETAARRLMAASAVAALAQASEASASTGLALPGPQANVSPFPPAAPVLHAAYLAWAGLEDTLDLSTRVCGAVLQRASLDAQGPSAPVQWLRRGIKLAYGTAGTFAGISEGLIRLASLAKQG